MKSLFISTQYSTWILSCRKKQMKETKVIQMEKGELKISLLQMIWFSTKLSIYPKSLKADKYRYEWKDAKLTHKSQYSYYIQCQTYLERNQGNDSTLNRHINTHTYMYMYMYIYVHIYIRHFELATYKSILLIRTALKYTRAIQNSYKIFETEDLNEYQDFHEWKYIKFCG